MRGTGQSSWPLGASQRIIPAHAGNSLAAHRCDLLVEDHPRTCGEQNTKKSRSKTKGGSSPHIQGTGEAETITVQMPGIIPAHAGNSGSGGHPTRRHRDHPRTCGEQDMIPATEIAPLGSSPHMRGTADGYESVEDNGGIIPAHAGNSPGRGFGLRWGRDHSRGFGEPVG